MFLLTCDSSSPAFRMMSAAYKLNKQGDNIQPWRTPFPILNQSIVPCPVLTVASWPAYRFLRRQVRWSGIPIFLRIFHSLLWSTQSNLYILIYTYIYNFSPMLHGLWDLSSTTRDQTHAPAWKRWALITGLPGNSPISHFLYPFIHWWKFMLPASTYWLL